MNGKPIMLIADDMEVNRALLRTIFCDSYEILEASNGTETLRLLNENTGISILLLDLIMPKPDGFEVMAQMRADVRLSRIPIIVNTQYGEENNELRALAMGAMEFITKPYKPEIIRRRVNNISRMVTLEQQRLSHELESTTQQLNSLIEHMPGGVAIYRLEKTRLHLIYFNDQLAALSGMSRREYEQLVSDDVTNAIWPADRESLRSKLNAAMEKGDELESTFRFLRRDGSYGWVHMNAVRFGQEGGCPIYHALFVDVTHEKETEQELIYNSEYDRLTGVYNREAFYRHTAELFSSAGQTEYEMICWDISRFKVINDLFGSEMGDYVLQKIARDFSSGLRGIGLCGRLESDCFATCLPQSLCDPKRIDRDIRSALKSTLPDYDIIINMGFYKVEDKKLPVSLMCDRALLALNTVKGNYLNRYAVYDDTLRRDVLKEQSLTSEMNTALEQGQFFVQLQPIYGMLEDSVIGAEALVRWMHPKRGLIPPGDFIPLFERNGFIVKLDRFVREEVLTQLENMRASGMHVLPVSVNVSRQDFYDPELADEIEARALAHGVPPELLRIEVTESAYAENTQQLIQTLKRLKDKGFILLMDDFGSGFSSLNMLKDAPMDVLKVDMRFMNELETSSKAGTILTSVMRMAKWLGMRVMAEGVETDAQFRFLRAIGCGQIQGYYYSRPMPVSEFETFIQQQQPMPEKEEHDQINPMDLDVLWNANPVVHVLLNSMMGAMTIFERQDDELDVIRVNDAYYELMEITPSALLADCRNMFDSLSAEQHRKLFDALDAAEQRHQVQEIDLPRLLSGGRKVWLKLRMQMLGTQHGHKLYIFSMQDITEQVRRSNEKRIDLIMRVLNTMFIEIYEMDFEEDCFRDVHVDENLSPLFGYSGLMSEITQRIAQNIIHPLDREIYQKYCHLPALRAEMARTDSDKVTMALRIRQGDGYIWRRRTVLRIRENGRPDAYFSCIASMSEEMAMQEEYQRLLMENREQERYRIITEQTGAVVVETDAKGQITFVGGGFANYALSRYASEKVFSRKNLPQTVAREDWDKAHQFYVQMRSEMKTVSVEIRLLLMDGTEQYTRVTLTKVINAQGEIERIVGTLRDISQRKQAELALEERSRQASETAQRLYELMENLPVGIFTYEGKVDEAQYINRRALNWMQIDKAQFVKQALPMLLTENLLRTAREQGEANQVQTIARPDGGEANVRVLLRVITNAQGREAGFATFSDNSELMQTQHQLLSARDQLQHLMDNLPVGVGIFNISGGTHQLFANERTNSLFGLAEGYLQHNPVNVADYVQIADDNLQPYQALAMGESRQTDRVLRAWRADGVSFWLRAFATVVHTHNDEFICYTVLADITRNMELERDYHSKNEIYRALMEESRQLIFDYDLEKDVLDASYPTAEGRTSRRLTNYIRQHNADNAIVVRDWDTVAALVTGKKREAECRISIEHSPYRWYRVQTSRLTDEKGVFDHVIGHAMDITTEKERLAEQEMQLRRAQTDPVTHLNTRAALELRIAEHLAQPGAKGVFFLYDVDNFKLVNDTYGHTAGDALLRRIADQLRRYFRSSDIKGRLGGDELVVFARECAPRQSIEQKARATLKAIENLTHDLGWDIPISVSLGIALAPENGDTMEKLYRAADVALYHVKESGKNGSRFAE